MPVPTYDPKTNNDTDIEVLPDTSKDLTKDFCRSECKKAIEGTSCEAIVSSSFYIDACITDLYTTGDKTLIEVNRLAYAQTCATLSKTSGNSTLELKQEIGFDHYTCPNNCTSVKHGICGENGCKCLPDYSGFDCSILLVVPIQSIASTPTSVSQTAPSTAIVVQPAPTSVGQPAPSTAIVVQPSQPAPTSVGQTAPSSAIVVQPSQPAPTSVRQTAPSTSVVPPEEQPVVAAASSIQAHMFIVLTALVFVV